jgi:hypothetical protein
MFARAGYPGVDNLFEIEPLIQPGDSRTDDRPRVGSHLFDIKLNTLPLWSSDASLAQIEPTCTPE